MFHAGVIVGLGLQEFVNAGVQDLGQTGASAFNILVAPIKGDMIQLKTFRNPHGYSHGYYNGDCIMLGYYMEYFDNDLDGIC